MKSGVIVSMKVTGGWKWLLATIMGICPIELIAAGSRSHNQNRLISHLYTFLGSKEVSSSTKLAVLQASCGAETLSPFTLCAMPFALCFSITNSEFKGLCPLTSDIRHLSSVFCLLPSVICLLPSDYILSKIAFFLALYSSGVM